MWLSLLISTQCRTSTNIWSLTNSILRESLPHFVHKYSMVIFTCIANHLVDTLHGCPVRKTFNTRDHLHTRIHHQLHYTCLSWPPWTIDFDTIVENLSERNIKKILTNGSKLVICPGDWFRWWVQWSWWWIPCAYDSLYQKSS